MITAALVKALGQFFPGVNEQANWAVSMIMACPRRATPWISPK